jgi:hypothetical protein
MNRLFSIACAIAACSNRGVRAGLINGTNYGNVFIPENFFADEKFYQANGIEKVATEYSLCDVTGDNAGDIMRHWLEEQIKESDFVNM